MKITKWTKGFSLYYPKHNLAMKNKPFFSFPEKMAWCDNEQILNKAK